MFFFSVKVSASPPKQPAPAVSSPEVPRRTHTRFSRVTVPYGQAAASATPQESRSRLKVPTSVEQYNYLKSSELPLPEISNVYVSESSEDGDSDETEDTSDVSSNEVRRT